MKLPAYIRVLCKSENGAALLELWIVLFIIFPPFLFAALDFGRYYYAGLALTNIVHAGAAYGAQNPTSSYIAKAASQVTPPIPDVVFQAPVPTVILECDDGNGTSTNLSTPPACTSPARVVYLIQVTDTATYHTIAPWPGIPSSFNISRTAIMRGCYAGAGGETNC
jgi:hypothetical protein